jgi:predicted ATPase/GAF domain-containing protein
MSVSGYILEPIREDDEFVLYRGRGRGTRTDKPGVLVLKPAAARPRLQSLNKLKHEYSLRDELLSEWAIRPLSLSEDDNGQATLVFECPGGEPLDRLAVGPMEMGQFLRISVGLATALMGLHKGGLIHKDLKPANVIVNPATFQVWLTGFGIASRLVRERQNATPLESIEGTLTYMAPEQTGRMNRSIDSRSDLYALGVILYEMVTGRLPFSASDSMEWMHCHIARQPAPPTELRRDLPPAVCAIILKLLAKTPEERYQTAAGVLSDLQRCLSVWSAQGRIVEFSVGEDDTPDRLLIPEGLYGRAGEIETLINAFNRIVAGGRPELVLVSGYAGIGKSSVVNELHKVLVPPRGLFASGKFDQYKRDVPYATLAQAFSDLIRLLLSKSESELQVWRDAFREALEPNANLMSDLVPELKLIIGEQPPVPELPPQGAQRRFQLVFRRFIGVFARPEHPLALFLDDLQWLDAATLDFLENLFTQGDVHHLMLIGAYRDNEVDSTHPLWRRLEAMRRTETTIHEIVLAPLVREDLAQLIVDSVHCEPERAVPLAELIHGKTGGNPFFVIQFIRALVEEQLLTFDHVDCQWCWELNCIKAKGHTDNVVELMVEKLNRLSIKTQKALQALACLGNSAEATTISIVQGTSEEQVHSDLWEAVRLELVARQEGVYKFIHDRIQEAAYSLIPKHSSAETHLKIGRLLWTHVPPEKKEEAIFEIVNQLNRGTALITSQDERERLAQLNFIAGNRAKTSTAYHSALNYLAVAAALLPDDSWERLYELTFSIEYLTAECELLTADMESTENRLSLLADHAKSDHDIGVVTRLRLTLYTALDRSDRVIEVCLEYLRRSGTYWSAHPTSDEARREYDRIWSQLGSRQIEELIDLPLITNPGVLDVLDVLTEIVTTAMHTDVNLSSLVVCHMVNLSLEHGNSDASCFAYVWFAIIAGPRFGNYQGGFRFGRLGYELVQQRGLKRYEARTYMSFGNLVIPWSRHARSGRDLIHRAFEAANRIGDLTFAAYCRDSLNSNSLTVGDPLAEVQSQAEEGLGFAKKLRFGFVIDLISVQVALIRTLRGLTPRFGSLNHEEFDETKYERHLSTNPVLALPECWYFARKTQARFLAGDYASALDASLRAQRVAWTSPSQFEKVEFHFYGALAHAACWDCVSDDQKQEHFQALTSYHKKFQIWAEHCPENFENRAALLGAEIARIEGRQFDAMQLYEQAIRCARENGFVHIEGVANEVAARFYMARGFEKIADSYLREARYCYLRWGADGKVKQLDELYPQLVKQVELPGPKSTIMASVELLELTTVISVSQAISGEINLEKLIDTVMRLAIQHAGAERGLLVLPRGTEYRIGAESTTILGVPRAYLREGPVEAESLPRSILNYVVRTKKSLILDDASTPNEFSGDAYFIRHRARSLLCLPLLNQAELIGVLYLENKLTPRVFDGARVAVLQVIASQAAISLTNSYLYREQKEAETALRRSEAFLAEAQKLSHTGSCGWNVSNGELVWSEETYRIVGIALTTKPTLELVWQIVHPEDRDIVQRAIDEAARISADIDSEPRIVMSDGSIKDVHLVMRAVKNQNGNLEYIGALTDVTATKNAFRQIEGLKDQLQRENVALREEVDAASMFEEIVGTSPPLRTVLSRVSKVAPTDSTVLITGETGTGKELIARAIHKRSARARQAFVSVNCAAIPLSLIHSELFGHERGAFTGALQRKLGRFELARGGTLFLDEVGEIPAETQVALLRVLQENEFERVGGTQSIKADVRLITATNRDLEQAISSGVFRSDLFYRLNVFPIEVPPLRKRKDDIPVLTEYFIHRFAGRMGKKISGISRRTLELFQCYHWPGNIRELQNIIERSLILCGTKTFSVDASWLVAEPPVAKSGVHSLSRRLPADEKATIEAALAQTHGRVSGPSGAAIMLGLPASTLESKIRGLKIDKHQCKAPADNS